MHLLKNFCFRKKIQLATPIYAHYANKMYVVTMKRNCFIQGLWVGVRIRIVKKLFVLHIQQLCFGNCCNTFKIFSKIQLECRYPEVSYPTRKSHQHFDISEIGHFDICLVMRLIFVTLKLIFCV